MRLGIDCHLTSRHLGGMAVYIENLVRHLREINPSNSYLIFDNNPDNKLGFKKNAWTVIGEQIWLQFQLPYKFWKEDVKVAYFPNPPISFFLTMPIVLTIPDVSFMHDSSMSNWAKGYLWVMYFLSAHKARVITTFSQSSKGDIAGFFKVDARKIKVIPLAASDGIKPQNLKKKSDKDYVITVPGTFVSRKNIEATILAFKHLPIKLRNTLLLVVVGKCEGEGYEKVKDFVKTENMTQSVFFAGRVNDHELSVLYSRAKLFVCSSLYEGFGLPILEAMKCGAPVISYNNSSLPEVVGNAGILVNNVGDLSQAMKKLLLDEKLRERFKKLGVEREAFYSWDKTASSFLTQLPKNVD